MESNERREQFEERHFTVPELASMWRLSREFVRQVVQHEPGVTEWVRQEPGRRRYRVLRVPQSVAERLYHRALGRAEEESDQTISGTWAPLTRKRRRPSTRGQAAESHSQTGKNTDLPSAVRSRTPGGRPELP